MPSGGSPQTWPVVDVVGNDRAVASCGGHRRLRGFERQGKPSEDPTGMEPACTDLTEKVVPVDIGGFQRPSGRVSTVVGASCERIPNPRSVKFSGLRLHRPISSASFQTV